VYVGNLSATTTSSYLGRLFEPFGALRCNIIMDRMNPDVSRGFGFVEFSTRENMLKAIEASNGKMVNESEIVTNEARAREPGGTKAMPTSNSRFDQRFNFEKTHKEARDEDDSANLKAYFERKKAREKARAARD